MKLKFYFHSLAESGVCSTGCSLLSLAPAKHQNTGVLNWPALLTGSSGLKSAAGFLRAKSAEERPTTLPHSVLGFITRHTEIQPAVVVGLGSRWNINIC
jgi:hypothetical protein